ncbi:phosphatidylinositol 4-kinase alpha-like [Dysidea avara]|uniref:phosphatidylinositol 4-kinase alpha-like n=1 Tax=Dysidea avara TaxID=196820 RepID=UPI00332B6C79
MSYCSPRSFHSSCLISYARTLADLSTVPWEKIQWLMSFCPDLEDTSGLILTDDNLSGVVALGLFAIKSQLKHHGKRVLSYLLDLVRVFPTVHWQPNITVEARREGLIAERYCFKVTLILLALASINSEDQDSIVDTIVEVLLQLSGQFHKLEEKPADDVAVIILPAMLGMAWAFQSRGKWRVEQLELMFTSQSRSLMETADQLPSVTASKEPKPIPTELEFLKCYDGKDVALKTGQVEKLMKIVFVVLSSNVLQALDKKVKEYRSAHLTYSHQYRSAVVKYLMLSLSRTVTGLCQEGVYVISIAGEKQVDVVPAFVSSLGSKLYNISSGHSNYDLEMIIIILQVTCLSIL